MLLTQVCQIRRTLQNCFLLGEPEHHYLGENDRHSTFFHVLLFFQLDSISPTIIVIIFSNHIKMEQFFIDCNYRLSLLEVSRGSLMNELYDFSLVAL